MRARRCRTTGRFDAATGPTRPSPGGWAKAPSYRVPRLAGCSGRAVLTDGAARMRSRQDVEIAGGDISGQHHDEEARTAEHDREPAIETGSVAVGLTRRARDTIGRARADRLAAGSTGGACRGHRSLVRHRAGEYQSDVPDRNSRCADRLNQRHNHARADRATFSREVPRGSPPVSDGAAGRLVSVRPRRGQRARAVARRAFPSCAVLAPAATPVRIIAPRQAAALGRNPDQADFVRRCALGSARLGLPSGSFRAEDPPLGRPRPIAFARADRRSA